MDKVSLDRIDLLHPAIKDEVLKLYNHINQKVLGKGVRLRLTQTMRTFKEQDNLYAQGRTLKGSKVTDAKGGQSHHNYGLAFDIVILYDKDGDGKFEEVSWDLKRDNDGDGIADWLEITRVFESNGYQNGFIKSGKKWDFPHFQKDFGYTWQRLLEKHNRKEFITGTNYLKL